MAKFSDLPEDVIAKIWSLLPVKSVLRLKSVQKSWNTLVKALVKTPSFVADHLYNNTNRSTSSSFISTITSRCLPLPVTYTLVPNNKRKMTLLTLHPKYGVEVSNNPYKGMLSVLDGPRFFTNCNGIFCTVNDYGGSIKLLNPATRELKLIPGPREENPPRKIHVTNIGFGYDAVSDAYKVVEIFFEKSIPRKTAKVYTLGNDTSSPGWRKVEISASHTDPSLSQSVSFFSEGFVYWLGYLGTIFNHEREVWSFDMHKEKFETVSLPSLCELGSREGLVPWRKSIAWYGSSKDETSIGFWVMSAAEKCWTKCLSIPSVNELALNMDPGAFWKNGDDILMIDQSKRNVISYNVVENKYRLIYRNSSDSNDMINRGSLISHVDSFVSFRLL